MLTLYFLLVYVGEVARASRRHPYFIVSCTKILLFYGKCLKKHIFFLLVSYFYLTFAPANKQNVGGIAQLVRAHDS